MNKTQLPWVMGLLVTICFVLHFTLPVQTRFALLTTPAELIFAPSLRALGGAITAGFLHVDFRHLFSNCLMLTLLGFALEKKMGHGKTAMLLLLSGLGALTVHVLSNVYSPIPFLGASGYVFGIIAVYAALL